MLCSVLQAYSEGLVRTNMGPNRMYTYVGSIFVALVTLMSPLPSLAWKLCNNYPTEVAEL